MYEEYGTKFDYFSRLDLTLLTLFQLMTLDGWVATVREIVGIHTWAWVPLFFFITLAGIFVTNMVVAIICESIQQIVKADENQNDEEETNLKIRQIQEEMMVALGDEINKHIVYPNSQHHGH